MRHEIVEKNLGLMIVLIVLTITGFEAIRSALTDRVKQAESA